MRHKKMSYHLRQQNRQGWLSVLPVILLELLICAYPIGVVVAKSFTNWDGLFKNDFVGLRNYARILTDENFWVMMRNTGVFLLTIPVQALIGVTIAVILYEKIPGWKFFRFVYYLPSIISMVTVGFLWRILFSYSGPINEILRACGLDQLAIEWLNSGPTARFVVFLCLVWSNIGWQVLIIFGGLSNISPSVFEAARLDGAGFWQQLFRVTLPMLMRTIEYSFITAMLWIFTAIFPLIQAITNGGPKYETTTLDYMVYIRGFAGSKFGQACALSVILLIIILIITVIQMAVSNKQDDWG